MGHGAKLGLRPRLINLIRKTVRSEIVRHAFAQVRPAQMAVAQKTLQAHISVTKFQFATELRMFHHDAHLRLSACDGLRSVRRAETAGVRARPRNTDANSLFEKIGLGGRARKL
jgi:hypothetical protein